MTVTLAATSTTGIQVVVGFFKLELPEAEVDGKKKYFLFPVAQELGEYKTRSSPSPLTQTHTYVQKLTHFPPTCIQIPPQYTLGHCEATKQKTTSRSKKKNTQGTRNSPLNQSERRASGHTRSLSHKICFTTK